MQASKRRKLNTGKYFPAELPEATGKEVAGDNTVVVCDLKQFLPLRQVLLHSKKCL
jgi:hypothetical protein